MSAKALSEVGNTELVNRIIQSDHEAINEFYRRFIRGTQYFLRRQGIRDSDVEDLAHDTIFTVVRQVQKGALQNPECLAGYVRTIAQREVYNHRLQASKAAGIPKDATSKFSAQEAPSPERAMIVAERSVALREAISHLKASEVEILTRFYLNEQKPAQIMREMGLTETQFRLQKCRAKARLTEETQKLATRQPRRPLLNLAA